jgi:hypothetical protein
MKSPKETSSGEHTINLTVGALALEDTWKDIVRIHKPYRKDKDDQPIKRGTICRLSVGQKSKWVIVHGREADEKVIQMDLNTRLALELKEGGAYDFTITRLTWLRSLWFPWKVSDPIFRVPAQLALISLILGVVLGLIGILVGLVPIYEEHKKPTIQQSHEPSATLSLDPRAAG